LPEAFLCFAFFSFALEAVVAIKSQPAIQILFEYCNKETPCALASRDRNLRGGVSPVLALPALSHS
jgi:hypothetical protein